MEMVYAGMASMLLGFWVGRALKLDDVGVIVCLTMAGGGSLLAGLAYLWIDDITVGQSGTLMWLVIGILGGIVGIIAFMFTRYADWFVAMCKKNGLL